MSNATITTAKPYGMLAEFGNPAELYHACEKVRDAGFQNWDAHTPFPVHGLEEAMGVASLVAPVPGGVGPMTIAMLMSNVVNLTKASVGLPMAEPPWEAG